MDEELGLSGSGVGDGMKMNHAMAVHRRNPRCKPWTLKPTQTKRGQSAKIQKPAEICTSFQHSELRITEVKRQKMAKSAPKTSKSAPKAPTRPSETMPGPCGSSSNSKKSTVKQYTGLGHPVNAEKNGGKLQKIRSVCTKKFKKKRKWRQKSA